MNEKESIENPTALLQRVHRWRMAFFGLVILFAGMVIGGAATVVTVGRPGEERARRPWGEMAVAILHQMSDDLKLTAEQTAALQPIIEKHMKALKEIRDKARPEVEEQLRLMHEEISALLTEEQRQRWTEHIQRLERGFWRDGRGPGPGGRRGPGPGPGGRSFRDRGERPDGRRWRESREGRPPGPSRPEGAPPMPPMERGPEQPQQDANDIRE